MNAGDVPIVRPMSRVAIESKANSVLFMSAPECLVVPQAVPVIQIFEFYLVEYHGFVTEVCELPPNYEGLMEPRTRTATLAPTVYEAAERGDGRARFTVGHEIGHGVLHAEQLGMRLIESNALQLARRNDIEPFRDPEWQANTFAAALLMPETMVRMIVQAHCGNPIARLERVFEVSGQAAETRLRKLRMMN